MVAASILPRFSSVCNEYVRSMKPGVVGLSAMVGLGVLAPGLIPRRLLNLRKIQKEKPIGLLTYVPTDEWHVRI